MEGSESRRTLTVGTAVAAIGAGAGLLSPDAGAAALVASPAMEALLSRVVGALSQRRRSNATETLMDAATASSESLEEFVQRAVSDERRHELLARTLGIAQDTALREKRRALGRALAAGVAGDDARIDDELLFIRAVADLDTPHIRLLGLLGSEVAGGGVRSGNVLIRGWTEDAIVRASSGFSGVLRPLLSVLELHGLISDETASSPAVQPGIGYSYNITQQGQELLRRLVLDPL